MNLQTSRRSLGMALLFEQTARSIYEGREAHGLFPAQWAALRYFSRAGRQARSVKGLARYLGVTPGPASRTASSLQRRGLVTSERSAEDGRMTFFTLTPTGVSVLANDPLLLLAAALDNLAGERMDQFAGLLDEISSDMATQRKQRGGDVRDSESENTTV